MQTLSPTELEGAPAGQLVLRLFGLPDETTLDLRDVIIRANQDSLSPDYHPRPVVIGDATEPVGLCVLAPFVQGTQARDLDWEYLKRNPGGGDHPALRIGGVGWSMAVGVRVDNLMNALRPVGEALLVRHAYTTHIRDDCLANDDLAWVRIEDSLFDGCYTAISARPDKGSPLWLEEAPLSSSIELDRVLIRMTPMPGGHGILDPTLRSFGHLWKWSRVAGPAVIRDSILMVDDLGDSTPDALDWPTNVTAQNVTIVWGGTGPYPGQVPPEGVAVESDLTIWEEARSTWLQRHGCTDVENCDVDRLVAPTGPGQSSP